MENEQKIQEGCIKGKIPLCDLTAKYRAAYTAIALIHHFGALRYGYYNWYNNPANCNSTMSDNLNAIFRHLVAHRMGKFIDPESHLPHVFHACCRAGMLITMYYRTWLTNSLIPNTPKKNETAKLDVVTQITTEEILVLTKDKVVPEYEDLNSLSDHIFELLCSMDMFDKCHIPDIELDNTNYCDTEDLVLSIWRYTCKLIVAGQVSYDISKLDDKLQQFMAQYNHILSNNNSVTYTSN